MDFLYFFIFYLYQIHATNVYVSTTGVDSGACGPVSTPCLTIQQAIDNSATPSSDTVIILPGTYDLAGQTTKVISIASAKSGLTITSQNSAVATTIVTFAATAANLVMFQIDGNDVTIRDLTIRQSTAPLAANVIAMAASRITITGCVIEQSASAGVSETTAIRMPGAGDSQPPPTYEGNAITNNQIAFYKYGIGVNGKDHTISDNTFTLSAGAVTSSNAVMLLYYLRGTTTVCRNTWRNNVNARRFFLLTSYGSGSTLDQINSRSGDLLACDNLLETCGTGSTKYEVHFLEQNNWNQYQGSQLTYKFYNNVIKSSPCVSALVVPYLSSSTDLNAVNNFDLKDNSLDKSTAAIVKMDAGE